MQQTIERFFRGKTEPYWYVILLLLVAGMGLFINHVSTGFTPGRVALAIDAFDFNIFWYGIIITAGIALGAYVVSRLAQERAERTLEREVPVAVRRRHIGKLKLPAEIERTLQDSGAQTVGDVLLRWGFGGPSLGLNKEGRQALRRRLAAERDVPESWLEQPPWRQWNPDHVWSGLVWCLILAVVGARLYHVLTPSPSMAQVGITSPWDYFRNPLQMINLRSGGLGIYGGIAGGALGLLIFTYRNRLSAMAWADLGVIGVALGQFVGRWGNFFNQELYGQPTDVPWALWIDPVYRLPGYTEFSRFHPAFLYESLWNLMVFVVLLTLERRYRERLFTGDLMATYLILYAIGRTLLETVRLDSRTVVIGDVSTGVPIATLVSIVIAVVMGAWIVVRHQRR